MWFEMNLNATDDRPEDRDGFRFRGGHVALDLAATLGARLKAQPRELLAAPADLDRWLVSAGLAEREPGATAEARQACGQALEQRYGFPDADCGGQSQMKYYSRRDGESLPAPMSASIAPPRHHRQAR